MRLAKPYFAPESSVYPPPTISGYTVMRRKGLSVPKDMWTRIGAHVAISCGSALLVAALFASLLLPRDALPLVCFWIAVGFLVMGAGAGAYRIQLRKVFRTVDDLRLTADERARLGAAGLPVTESNFFRVYEWLQECRHTVEEVLAWAPVTSSAFIARAFADADVPPEVVRDYFNFVDPQDLLRITDETEIGKMRKEGWSPEAHVALYRVADASGTSVRVLVKTWTASMPVPLAQAYLLAGFSCSESVSLHARGEDPSTETLQIMAALRA